MSNWIPSNRASREISREWEREWERVMCEVTKIRKCRNKWNKPKLTHLASNLLKLWSKLLRRTAYSMVYVRDTVIRIPQWLMSILVRHGRRRDYFIKSLILRPTEGTRLITVSDLFIWRIENWRYQLRAGNLYYNVVENSTTFLWRTPAAHMIFFKPTKRVWVAKHAYFIYFEDLRSSAALQLLLRQVPIGLRLNTLPF